MMVSSKIDFSEALENTCPSGFTYIEDLDGLSLCQDNDECTSKETKCSHKCRNLVGRFACECQSGYSLADDKFSCEGINIF